MSDAIRVLVVEDNSGDALLLEETLRQSPDASFELSVADSLAGALAFAKDRHFDLVLLDLGLPDSQGLATLQTIESVADAPIVVLTGLDDEQLGHQAMRHGAGRVRGESKVEPLVKQVRIKTETTRQGHVKRRPESISSCGLFQAVIRGCQLVQRRPDV